MEMNIRLDEYRTNIELGIDIAYETATQFEPNQPRPKTTERTKLVYDVYTKNNNISRVMLREDLIQHQPLRSLKDEHRNPDFELLQPPDSVYPNKDYTPPDRRVTIEFGSSPFIYLVVNYDKTVHVPPTVNFHWRDQLFTPEETNHFDRFTHRTVDKETLKNWVFEFVPRDPLDLHNEPEFEFLLGDDWKTHLETELIEYFFNEAFESEILESGGVFEPGYISGLLDCSYSLGEQLCRDLTGDSGPLSLVVADDDDQIEHYDYACASPDHWDDGDVYDYSTQCYSGASIDKKTGRIWV